MAIVHASWDARGERSTYRYVLIDVEAIKMGAVHIKQQQKHRLLDDG